MYESMSMCRGRSGTSPEAYDFPRNIAVSFCSPKGGHRGKPSPFGSPVFAKLVQYADTFSAISRSWLGDEPFIQEHVRKLSAVASVTVPNEMVEEDLAVRCLRMQTCPSPHICQPKLDSAQRRLWERADSASELAGVAAERCNIALHPLQPRDDIKQPIVARDMITRLGR
jgi:hypothetical protein